MVFPKDRSLEQSYDQTIFDAKSKTKKIIHESL